MKERKKERVKKSNLRHPRRRGLGTIKPSITASRGLSHQINCLLSIYYPGSFAHVSQKRIARRVSDHDLNGLCLANPLALQSYRPGGGHHCNRALPSLIVR